ncbi:MAG: type II toxin-antitoxin system Phd/YefM family antitoxin [Actinomycetota bacterium]
MTGATSGTGPKVGVRELRDHLSRYLDRVKAGEEITVTDHGRPVARLVAAGPEADRMADLVAAGIVVPARTTTRRLPTRRARLTSGPPISDVVTEQRR